MIEALEPGNQWDQTFICDLLAEVDHSGVHVLIIPGRYWFDKIDEVNNRLQDKPNVLVVITGDEEALLDTSQLEHPNMKIWVQSPHENNPRFADQYFPIGYTPVTRLKIDEPEKTLNWFFAGQDTHSRRHKCVASLANANKGKLVRTKGFTQGIPQEEYLDFMRQAITVPCPSGAVIPDSFRLYEALEAGCVPIADSEDPQGSSRNYWRFLFDQDDLPFPISDWDNTKDLIEHFDGAYPLRNNFCFAWWQQYKYRLKRQLQKHIWELSGKPKLDATTVLIPTSPISAHPSLDIIQETINSVRHYLPKTQILVMIDGLREEQRHYRERYKDYIWGLLWWINQQPNITPVLFEEHQHQARMTRKTLELVDTETIFFVEHDTPIVTDCEIFFDTIFDALKTDYDVVRLHHEARIHPEHEHLMVDLQVKDKPFLKTAQWSQRPHIANTGYYRRLLANIHEDSKTMIEDAIHGITQEKFLKLGYPGWLQHKIAIYAPEKNLKRSYHLDGRGNDPKYEMS